MPFFQCYVVGDDQFHDDYFTIKINSHWKNTSCCYNFENKNGTSESVNLVLDEMNKVLALKRLGEKGFSQK